MLKKKKIFEKKYLKLLGLVFIFISMFGFLKSFETYTESLELNSISRSNMDLGKNLINIELQLLKEGIKVKLVDETNNEGLKNGEELHKIGFLQNMDAIRGIRYSINNMFKAFIVCIIGLIFLMFEGKNKKK